MKQLTREEMVRQFVTKDNIVTWLKGQDPNTTYDYSWGTACLIAHFLKDMKVPVFAVSSHQVIVEHSYINPDVTAPIPREITDALEQVDARVKPSGFLGFKLSTFGAALAELESA